MFFRILEKLPPKLTSWLARKFMTSFQQNERIIRHIYSPLNINPTTNTLKANFLQFRYNEKTKENELSCSRFELEALHRTRSFGKSHSRPKAEYYGFACSSVFHIQSTKQYIIRFTPILDIPEPAYFHSDIYDRGNPPIRKGEALSSKMALERELFLTNWKPFIDCENLIRKSYIQPPRTSK